MRLVPSLSVLIAAMAAVLLAAGCGTQSGENPAPTATPLLASASVDSSPAVTVVPAAASLIATVVPDATPQPTPAPPVSTSTTGGSNQSLSPSQPVAPAQRAPSAAPPVRVDIPSVGVSASMENLGLTPDGGLDAPKNPDKVGWYDPGPRPGENGNALVDGHVDWAGKVRAFWYLQRLRPGDNIIVTDANGNRHEFAVKWSKWYDQYAPVNELFAQTDAPELTLITCGGQFDPATHRYLSRLAVRATLK